jgi:HrpA-like RNA helicase
LKQFPEITEYYGKDMMTYLRLDHIQGMNKPITFNRQQGVVYGGKENDQITQLQVVVSNYTTYNETAVIFEFNNQVNFNMSLHNMVVYPKIHRTKVANVRTVKDIVGLRDSHQLDTELTKISENLHGQVNA